MRVRLQWPSAHSRNEDGHIHTHTQEGEEATACLVNRSPAWPTSLRTSPGPANTNSSSLVKKAHRCLFFLRTVKRLQLLPVQSI